MKEEKTEKPTPKKVKESRKEGQVPRTAELGAWGSMLAFGLLLHWLVGWGADSIRELMIRSTSVVGDPSPADALILLREGSLTALLLSVALGAGVLVIGVLSAAGQGGIHMATKVAKPKWSRLSPLQGAKRMFGPHALWEGAKVLLKSAFVALLVWRAVQGLLPLLGGLVPMGVAIQLVAEQATALVRDVAVAGLVTAAADYAVQRRKMGKQTRMTKHEVKQEHKSSEGDPLIRSALRSRQLAAARNRMMADVPQADVVLVNPVHVAVALRYESDKGAPRVVAKGAGVVAAKIRERAQEARVPLVQDVPLARSLHSACEVGQEIPAELYQAVAQVLAFVLSRKSQGVGAGYHRSPREEAPLPAVSRAGRRRPGAGAQAQPDEEPAA
ncbi:MAG TPA: EscU/YscU/HrcU family type III secretion system export apparatus switch protein [Nocardioidaceae bacterium]|nr:EscU/YscU/HrcU family type III secretion system export apparatus switch protein [Nocardioidaceae bacterium]